MCSLFRPVVLGFLLLVAKSISVSDQSQEWSMGLLFSNLGGFPGDFYI